VAWLRHQEDPPAGFALWKMRALCSLSEKFPDLRGSHGLVAARLQMAAVAREFYHRSLENSGKLQGRGGIHNVVLRRGYHHHFGLGLLSSGFKRILKRCGDVVGQWAIIAWS
jgi:hypothetical protein